MPTLNRTAFYKKLFIVAAVGLVLAVAVQSTFNMKYWMFGQTPFEYSFRLATTYSLNSAFATLERLSRSALAAVGFTHTDATASSNAPAQAIPVLTYHRIVNDGNDTSNVTVALFRDQMRKLKDAGWNTVTLKEFESYMRGERSLPEKSFLLTFDDGAKESFYPVDPILQSLGYNAVIFVIVQSSNTPKSTYYLSPQELTQMLRTGRWEIGSHSYDGHHPYLTNTGDNGIFFADKLWLTDQNRLETDQEFTDRVRADLTRAKSELNSTYGGPIDTFAFPLGNETGIAGAGNFPEGAAITTEVAKSIYKFGFLQGDYQEYTPNFPVASTSEQSMIANTRRLLASDFIIRRIHVDHDWDGKRLLSILENARMKTLPYEDDFSTNKGWISAWGSYELGRNNLLLKATPTLTSASTFLDGSELWDNYSFAASVNWHKGSVFMLADVTSSLTYDACVFAPGSVSIQTTVNGQTRIIKKVANTSVLYGNAASVGIRVHGSTIECLWNFGSIIESYDRTSSGGVGIQTWDSTAGAAELQVSSVIVRAIESESTTLLK